MLVAGGHLQPPASLFLGIKKRGYRQNKNARRNRFVSVCPSALPGTVFLQCQNITSFLLLFRDDGNMGDSAAGGGRNMGRYGGNSRIWGNISISIKDDK